MRIEIWQPIGIEPSATYDDRLKYLHSIRHEGQYSHPRLNHELNVMCAKIGYPVNHLVGINTGTVSDYNPQAYADCRTSPDGESQITLYQSALGRGKAGIYETFVHEFAHVVSPFKDRTELYGSPEAQKEAQKFAIAIAEQTIRTNRAIDGYHKYLLNKLNKGEISEALFYEETLAILHQQRMTNPNHLREVQESQKNALERQGRLHEFVELFDASQQSAVGIDAIILTLIPELNNDMNALNNHINGLRKEYLKSANNKYGNILTLRAAAITSKAA